MSIDSYCLRITTPWGKNLILAFRGTNFVASLWEGSPLHQAFLKRSLLPKSCYPTGLDTRLSSKWLFWLEKLYKYLEQRSPWSLRLTPQDFSKLQFHYPWQKNILLSLKVTQDKNPGLTTYQNIARLNNTHPRVVAKAMALNPYQLFIPCHRVLASRHLGGYQGGSNVKKKILKFEQWIPAYK